MSNYTRVLTLAASGDPSGLLLKLRSRTPLIDQDFDRLVALVAPLLRTKLKQGRAGRPRKTIEQKVEDGLTIRRAVEMYSDRKGAKGQLYGRRADLIREVASECGVSEEALNKKLRNVRKKPS